MKAKIWTLVFTVILFAAVSGCGKTAAQETEITQQASLEAADKAFCEAGAAQAESFFKTGAASCPVLHSYGRRAAPGVLGRRAGGNRLRAGASLSKTRRCALVSGTERRRRYFLCKISAAGANRRRQRYCVRLRAPSGAGVESDAEREFLLPPLSRRRQALRRLPAYPDKCAGQSTFRCTRTLRASD